jgi:lipopolysaccharide heptosyltransferase I
MCGQQPFLVTRHQSMPESSQRFLVIRLSSIGDIVHALPAVAALADTFPRAEIHWVVETCHAALLAGNPFVHRLVKLDTLGWRKNLASAQTLRSVAQGVAALREVVFEAAIDFQGLYKSALIAWLSRARGRLGFAEYWLREPAAAVFYTERVSPHGCEHVIQMNLALVERLAGCPLTPARWQFPLPGTEADERYVEEQLAALGAQEFIVINPGGGWSSKCWAPENYAELIRRLENEFSGDILLTGSPEEETLIRDIIRNSRSRRAKRFASTIVEFIALVRRAKLFLSGDTGPLHLAAAAGTPVVAIYGPTDPARNGPFSPADIALWNRGPIDYTRRTPKASYLPGISVESVLAAIHERLGRAYG